MKTPNTSVFRYLKVLTLTFLLQYIPAAAGPNPDFTDGGTVPDVFREDKNQKGWNLGATGARGWIYSDNFTTTDARQIYITKVAPNSPGSNGGLQVGDVIIGVDNKAFEKDARIELAKAIIVAETGQNQGELRLFIWRNGNQFAKSLQMPRLGNYSNTAPFNCPKTDSIVDKVTGKLVLEMGRVDYNPRLIPRSMNALALLSTGNPDYHALVKRSVRLVADERALNSTIPWYTSYSLILLAEYTMATGDKEFLPQLTALAQIALDGQSGVGTWGQAFPQPGGRLEGYGMMHAVGIPMTIGLHLAQSAGVNDPRLSGAIENSALLVKFYAGKGGVPYGDHHPETKVHDDNGKCSMSAVLFRLLGDSDTAEHFSKVALASHTGERDTGHSGNFFSAFWAMPAISNLGPEATGAWFKEFGSWYFDLARRHDGSFLYQGLPGELDIKFGNWDSTGSYLLAYMSLGKHIHLTGKDQNNHHLTESEAEDTIDAGRGWTYKDKTSYYDSLSDDELYTRLGSWAPAVRERAAKAIHKRFPTPQQRLINLLGHQSLEMRYGATTAIAKSGVLASAAVDKLLECLSDNDLWLRVQAAIALGKIGSPAMAAATKMLSLLATEDEVDDPRGMARRYITHALFDIEDGLLGRSTDGLSKSQLTPIIIRMLSHESGEARKNIALFDTLEYEEIRPLLPAILEAVGSYAPIGNMESDAVREAGIKTLQQHNIGDGLQAAVDYLDTQNPWQSEHRIHRILNVVKAYGTHAKTKILQLEAIANKLDVLDTEPFFPNPLNRAKAQYIREAVVVIRGATNTPTLVWIADIDTSIPIVDTREVSDPTGLIDPLVLSGNNPATNDPWRVGDKYRMIFITSEISRADRGNINSYNQFVQNLANNSSIQALRALTWKVVGSTHAVNARDNTSTNPSINGTGEPIFLIDGSTIIANNYEDLWDGITAPIRIDENGVSTTTLTSRIFTGSLGNGTTEPGYFLDSPSGVRTGSADPGKVGLSWMRDFQQGSTIQGRFYALSAPITIEAQDTDNLLAWALGAPDLPVIANKFMPVIDVTSNPDYLIFTYRRNQLAHNDAGINIAVEYSPKIRNWTAAKDDGENIIIKEYENGFENGIDKVEVFISHKLGKDGRNFARLNINRILEQPQDNQ